MRRSMIMITVIAIITTMRTITTKTKMIMYVRVICTAL